MGMSKCIAAGGSGCGAGLTRRGGIRRSRSQRRYIDERRASRFANARSEKSRYRRMQRVEKSMGRSLSPVFEEHEQNPSIAQSLQLKPASSSTTTTSQARNWEAVYIKETGTRCGRGVFAARNFDKGHRIIVERPIISCIHWMQHNGRRTIVEEWAKLSTEKRARLRSEFGRRLKDLPLDSELQSQHKKILKHFVEEYGFWDPQRARAHIFTLGSHINHACRSCANAEQWTDSEWPHLMTVKLVKPLDAGDEVFINYNRKNLSFGCAVCSPTSLKARLRCLSNCFFR